MDLYPLVSTKSFYEHFASENNKNSKMYQKHLISNKIGYKCDWHNLVG